MKLLVQRVTEARVTAGQHTIGSIGPGLLVLLGIGKNDTTADADYLMDRVLGLRIFPDEAGKMNRSIVEFRGSVLIVSQFALYADCIGSRRPSFSDAAPPEAARELYDYFVATAPKGPVP